MFYYSSYNAEAFGCQLQRGTFVRKPYLLDFFFQCFDNFCLGQRFVKETIRSNLLQN